MQQDKADIFVITNAKYLPAGKIYMIKERLLTLDESKMPVLYSVELKDPLTIFLFSIFLGSFGVDRFILGDIGLGIIKLITLGGCGIWTIIDWFLIQNRTRERNFNALIVHL